MKHLYLLSIALLCLSDLSAQVRRKLAVIGSSTAAGQKTWPPDSAYVSRLDHYYKVERGVLETTYGLGVGGYNVYKGMPTGYTPPPTRDRPDNAVNITMAISELSDLEDPSNGVIIVNYPSNGYVDFSITEIINCLQIIYDAAIAAGHKCYITTTQPRQDGAFGTSEMKRKMADIKDAIINTFGVEHTLNFWDGMYNPADTTILDQFSANDDIHFNNAGHRELFNRVVAKNVFGLSALPITISQFSGALKNFGVELKWTAHHDDANSYFLVQRSTDGSRFESLAKINVDNDGSGKKLYRFEDGQASSGTVYYRLEAHEPARTYYSSVISVQIPLTNLFIKKIYPTRVTNTLTLEIVSSQEQVATLEIISSSGARLKTYIRQLYRNNNVITLPVPGLAAGSYYLRIIRPGSDPIIQTFLK